MSDIEVKIESVYISNHPGADRLSVVTIGSKPGEGGYECVVGLDQFKNGDLVIYVPPGSVVPESIQEHLAKNKISMKSGRVRPIRIRGVLSEGLCLDPEQWLDTKDIKEGKDITEILGVLKYEPPVRNSGIFNSKTNNHYKNENFKKYDCVSHFKKYPGVLELGEEVVITTKFHGTSHRAGLANKPEYKKAWWERIKYLFIKEEPKEYLVGSHNAIRYMNKSDIKNNKHKDDLYWKATIKYDLHNIAKQISDVNTAPGGVVPDVIIYAEIIGPKIQTGYAYSVPSGNIEIRVFDIMVNKEFLNWDSVKHLCDCFNLPIVDELYVGPWSLDLLKMAQVVDEYDGKKFNREGIVIRPAKERYAKCGRVMLKYINPDYAADKKNSDYH